MANGEEVRITAEDVAVVDLTPRMKPAEKYPELWSQFQALKREMAQLQEQTAPLQAEYDRLRAEIAPTEARMRELGKEIKAIEQPRSTELGRQIAALARAMGATTLVNEGPKPAGPAA